MSTRQFVLVVLDRDTGEFTIEGPMIDDRPWNIAVVEAQRTGRNLRCFGMGDLSPDAAAGNGWLDTAASDWRPVPLSGRRPTVCPRAS